MLQGLPDFGQMITGEHFLAFAPYQGMSNVAIVPLRLKVARNKDGRPAFSLEKVRGINPFASPGPYGLFDLRVEPGPVEEVFVEQIRGVWPNATITSPHFYQGFLRLNLVTDSFDEVVEEMASPQPLEGVQVSRIRLFRHLSVEAVSALKQALEGELMLVEAFAELELKGIAPRIAAKVSFNPAELIRSLESFIDEDRLLPVAKITDFFQRKITELPLVVNTQGDPLDPERFAEVMTDRITARFATFAPAPDAGSGPHLKLQTAEEAGEGQFEWDLSEPLLSSRVITFRFDALAEARELVRKEGIESLFTETVISQLPTGALRLLVTHNLPEPPGNVLEMGVKIQAPPRQPYRPQPINRTVAFLPGEDEAVVELRYSPFEAQEYTYTPYVIFRDSEGTRELLGGPAPGSGQHLRVGTEEFPLDLVEVEASRGLLAEATIDGVCEWSDNGDKVTLDFSLTTDQPQKTLALPKNAAENSRYLVEARALDSDAVVKTEFGNFRKLDLDRFSFAEYGPHTVHVTCLMDENAALSALDLAPEGRETDPAEITTLAFTSGRSQRTWSWFADSVFEPGFRYRLHNGNGAAQEWSEIQSPFLGKLEIDLRKNKTMPMIKGDHEFGSLRYFQNPAGENAYYFIPDEPGPQTDPQGKPSLSLIITGETGFLQLGVQWKADPELLEGLREKLAGEKEITPAAIELSFGPVKIDRVDLVLNPGDSEQVLATSASSGYPPYSAIFNCRLDTDQQDLVIAALHQREDILQVQYHATREVEETARILVQGQVEKAREDLDGQASLEDCREWVRKALDENTLMMDAGGAEGASENLRQLAETKALNTVATEVLRYLQLEDPASFDPSLSVEIIQTGAIHYPFVAVTDIGNWFAGREGDNHIRIMGTV